MELGTNLLTLLRRQVMTHATHELDSIQPEKWDNFHPMYA